MNDFITESLDISLVKKGGISKTNPMVKFIIVVFISFALFFYLGLIKIYGIVFILIIFFLLWPLPYEIAKPRYKMIVTFSVTIFLVQILFNQNGDLLFHIFNFKIGNSGPFFPIYSQGVYQGLLLMGRFWGLISVSWIFVNSTNPFEFAHSLTKIKIPYRIAFTLSLALRFAPVFSNETKIIRNAQQARGLNIKSNNISGIKNILKFTLIPLIGSTLNRILGLTISMQGRACGSYNNRSYVSEVPFTVSDLLKLIIIIAFLVILSLV
jgi:energy-coupling factor transport system permease protein